MEYQKITNLLGPMLDEIPRFITKKWVEVHDQSGSADDRCKPNRQIGFKTSMLRSDLCDYSDAHIVVKANITLKKTITRGFIDARNRFLAFKNNAPFTNCISKINKVLIGNAENLNTVMPICLNTVKIAEKQQEFSEIITETSLIILLLMMMTPLLLITMQTL